MANGFKGLSQKLEDAKYILFAKSARIRRAGAIKADSILVTSTPVDTGLARSNWLPSVRAPRNEVIKLQAEGNSTIVTPRSLNFQEWNNIDVNTPIYLTNNVEYIVYLNDGHSGQAPAGFVEKAIAGAIAIMKTVK